MSEPLNLSRSMLGQYEVLEMVSVGTIILTYRGYQASLKRHVTLQTLAPHLRKDALYHHALARGAGLLAEFEHPHIVPIIDFGVQGETPYLVTRRMKGGVLRNLLQKGPLSVQQAVALVQQIGDALEYVHSLGKVHGDPATSNIVFDVWGSAYLSDFIMAGFHDTQVGGLKGVPFYMAPERWNEETPTPSTDQYALAAVAYDALTGEVPFLANDMAEMMQKHLEGIPIPVHERRADIPAVVNDVILRGMAKTPQERYPTVMDFAREFEKAMSATPDPVFISYSRQDKTYAQALKDHLLGNQLPVWIDDRIEHGDHWFNEIHEAVKGCSAFIVVMTPQAEQSEWVQKEILLARRYKKPIFPVLLRGDEFAILIDIQFADVRDQAMPNTEFHRRVSRAVYGGGQDKIEPES